MVDGLSRRLSCFVSLSLALSLCLSLSLSLSRNWTTASFEEAGERGAASSSAGSGQDLDLARVNFADVLHDGAREAEENNAGVFDRRLCLLLVRAADVANEACAARGRMHAYTHSRDQRERQRETERERGAERDRQADRQKERVPSPFHNGQHPLAEGAGM